MPGGEGNFLFPLQTGCGSHTAFHSVGTGVLPREKSALKLTTHVHLVSLVGMSGAIPLLLVYVFMTCKENFTFSFYKVF
jgi:hypothetical protein